ncbi:scavenger receptor cysteine-rich domain-containing protein DMBT1-like [Cetorhinus maximus]
MGNLGVFNVCQQRRFLGRRRYQRSRNKRPNFPEAAFTTYSEGQIPIRLVNGQGSCSGRVEVYYDSIWKAVCDDDWDIRDASVACRQIGCGPAKSAPGSARFGPASGSFWLDDVQCTGTEPSLFQCQAKSLGDHNCSPGEAASVICSDEILVRLTGGMGPCSGRVELYHEQEWRAVCDDDWDLLDAGVACKQVGCGPAISSPHRAHFGAANRSFWLDNVNCGGTELNLFQCQASTLGEHNCSPSEAASAICSDAIRMRLKDGGSPCSGRVELYYNATWGAVCDDSWDMLDAEVACKQMDCGPVKSASHSARFGVAPGGFWLDDVDCTGTESNLFQCRAPSLGQHNCGPGEAASVICTETFPVRLVDGENACSGRVEIYYNNTWGTVCDDDWDIFDAEVVCTELNCGFAQSAPGNAVFGQGDSSIWLDSVQCNGSEPYLWQCQSLTLGQHNCSHQEVASAVCSGQPLKPILSLERKPGIFLTRDTITMTCAALPFYAGSTFYLKRRSDANHMASATAPAGVHSVTFSIQDVVVGHSGNYTCHYEREKSGNLTNSTGSETVYAYVTDQIPIRLFKGINSCSGRVEVYYNGTWGAVCDGSWDVPDADVVCRQLGCGPALSAPGGAHFGAAGGPFWMDDVECSGTESNLLHCRRNALGDHSCSPGSAASAICTETFRTRLANGDGPCSGRVEIYYNYAWGTVCDDEWDMPDAQAVCTELRCGYAVSAPGNSEFGGGSCPIWLDSVQCNGSEDNLWQCRSKPLGQHNCDHQEDASVICSDRPLRPILSLQRKPGIFIPRDTIRMTCSALSFYAGCTFYLQKAGGVHESASAATQGTTHSVTFVIQDVDLRSGGNYTCHYQTGRPGRLSNSSSSDPVQVDVTDDLPLRLADGDSPCSGRVELYYNRTWGSVCDDGWELPDAEVACRQAGCGPAREAPPAARFGPAPASFLLDDVQCDGSEASLLRCAKNPLGEHNCGPDEAASAICTGNRGLSYSGLAGGHPS